MTTSPGAGQDRGRERRVALLLLAGCALVAILAYARVLPGAFQFDDVGRIVRNRDVRELERFLGAEAWSLAARPLTTFTFALNYAAGGLDPAGYHAVNLALHLATGLLLFVLGRRALRSAALPAPAACAAAAAGLFLVHPLQTESVSYVVQRSESLASLLYVAALLLLLEATERPPGARAALAYAGALVAAAAALAAKPIAATLPLAYLLFGHVFDPAPDRTLRRAGRRVLAALPFVAISSLAAWQGLRGASGSSHAGLEVPGLSLADSASTQLRVVLRYVALLAVPAGQNVDHDVRVSRSLLDPATLAAAAAIAAAGGAALATALRRAAPAPGRLPAAARVAAFGVLWFLVLLLPSSLVPLVDVMAEHRTYLAAWGLLLAAVAAAQLAADALALAPGVRLTAVALLVAALGAATWARNGVWESDVALWSDAAGKSPQKPRPLVNLGWALGLRGQHAEAVTCYERALRLGPDAHLRAEALRNLGASLAQLGRPGEALEALRAAAADPDVEADARSLMGMALLELQLPDAAREQVSRALRIAPDHGAARNTLGQVYLALRDPAAALEQFRIAARLDPDVPVRHFNVALALEQLGRRDEACAEWHVVLALETAAAPSAAAQAHLRALGCAR